MASHDVEGTNKQLQKQEKTFNQIMTFDNEAFDVIEKKKDQTITEKIFSNWSSQQQHGNDGIYSLNDFLRIDPEQCFASYGRVVTQQINEIQALIRSHTNAKTINTVRSANVTDSDGVQSKDCTQIKFLIKGGMVRMQSIRHANSTDLDWYMRYAWKGVTAACAVALTVSTLEWVLRKYNGNRRKNKTYIPGGGVCLMINPLYYIG
eukprot:260728_1